MSALRVKEWLSGMLHNPSFSNRLQNSVVYREKNLNKSVGNCNPYMWYLPCYHALWHVTVPHPKNPHAFAVNSYQLNWTPTAWEILKNVRNGVRPSSRAPKTWITYAVLRHYSSLYMEQAEWKTKRGKKGEDETATKYSITKTSGRGSTEIIYLNVIQYREVKSTQLYFPPMM